MRIVNIHEAKTNLSKLIEGAATHGEAFIIAKAGRPVVKVVPIERSARSARRIGFLKGSAAPDDVKSIARDEIAALFDGST